MKHKLRIYIVVFAVVCILTSQVFAITFYDKSSSGYDIVWSDDILWATIAQVSLQNIQANVLRASPYWSDYEYKIVLSYDELAAKASYLSSNRLNTSLYRNDDAGYWVAVVHDIDGFLLWNQGNDNPAVLGNANGYVYVAEIDTTGEEAVDLLSQILTRLHAMSSFLTSIRIELLDQGHVLDDIYDAIDSIDGYVYDIKDRLYYNGKSAAYYLYKIESHLATIANNSGSSGGSSSGTDLSGVLDLLDDVSQWTFDTKEYLYSISEKLDSSNSFLYELTFDMESVLSNQVDASLLLSWISSDVEDVLEELETATGLIGQTSDLLDQMNIHLSAVSTKLDGIGTVALEANTLNYYLYWISSDVQAILKKLETELDGISTIVTELTEARTYFAWINDHTFITNGLLEQMNTHLSAVSTKLDGIGTVAHETNTLNYYLYWISSDVQGVLKKLETDTANQQKIIDLLEDLELTTNVTIENIENIKIDVTNKAYEVFYITDSEGNEQNLADFSGDVLTISGRLLNFFFKVAFDDAMDSVDSALDDMTEFYIDDSVLVGGGSLWE